MEVNVNSISKNLSFEDKVSEKLKETIGDLITTDELKPLIEKGIQKTFFEDIITSSGGYYDPREKKNPLIVQMVKKHAKEHVTEFVEQWLKDNPEKIQEVLESTIKSGLGEIMLQAMTASFSNELCNFKYNVEQRFMRGGL